MTTKTAYKHPHEALVEFETTFGDPVPAAPALPADDELRYLRINLLREEFDEYLHAELNDDIVGIADALADLVYIAHGTAVRYGLPLDQIFDAVHRSNMAKVGPGGFVTRRQDGKVLKPTGWTPPDLEGIIARASARG